MTAASSWSSVAARIPGGQMADLVRLAVGVDLVEVQLRMALGEDLPDELVRPRFSQPLAIRFLTAEPGPLPTGRVTRIGSLDKVRAFPGVVQADVYLQGRGDPPGPARRRPARLRDRDGRHEPGGARARRGRGETPRRRGRMSCGSTGGGEVTFAHYRELLARRRHGGYRFAGFDRPPRSPAT